MNKQWFNQARFSVLALLIAIVWNAIALHPSLAHWADLSVAEIAVQNTDVSMTVTFPTGLVSFADRDQDGKLSTNELRQSYSKLESFFAERVHMKTALGEGKLTLKPELPENLPAAASDTTTTHSTLQLTYQWAAPIQALTIHYDLFLPGLSTAQCLATVFDRGQTQSIVFTPTRKEITLNQAFSWQTVTNFIMLGIEHILSGYDHILFLISLLLVKGSLRSLVKIVTAFTIAHSITLTLAVFNLVSLPSALVESLIALSIVYVAAENLWRKDVKNRWVVTFGFGLVHGLGFAGILQELNLAGSDLAISLVSFNLGVELGQIAIVTLIFLMLKRLQQFPWHYRMLRIASYGMIAIATFWFIERAFNIA